MKKLTLLVSFLLSGCVTLSQKPFPPAEVSLMEKCSELSKLQGETVKISQLMESVVNNYVLYYQCANKVEGWQRWYEEQKKNYEGKK